MEKVLPYHWVVFTLDNSGILRFDHNTTTEFVLTPPDLPKGEFALPLHELQRALDDTLEFISYCSGCDYLRPRQ